MENSVFSVPLWLISALSIREVILNTLLYAFNISFEIANERNAEIAEVSQRKRRVLSAPLRFSPLRTLRSKNIIRKETK